MLLRSRSSGGELSPPAKKRKKKELSPPAKKRKKKELSQVLPPTTISSLPDDLVLSSKKFRSFITSPELYEVRSRLGLTESCLYVCLEFGRESDHRRWSTLCLRPDTKTRKTKKQKNENLLVPIPFPQVTQVRWPKVVVIGSSIYFIGGLINNNSPCSKVSVLDCRFHTWSRAPDMLAIRKSRGANVVDGKIYVVGRPVNNDSCSWIEVFDPKTETWSSVPSDGLVISSGDLIGGSTEIEGKICMYGGANQGVAYDPKDGTFEPVEWDICKAWVCYGDFHCVVQNVLFYHHRERGFKWFDTKARSWKYLKGLVGMPKITRHNSVRIADYGGRIAVLWDKSLSSRRSKKKMIWCAVISLERRRNDEEEDDEIWGIVEWFDCVLKVPKSYSVSKAISATL